MKTGKRENENQKEQEHFSGIRQWSGYDQNKINKLFFSHERKFKILVSNFLSEINFGRLNATIWSSVFFFSFSSRL